MPEAGFAAAVLAPAGVRRLYGTPTPGLPVVASPAGIAGVLARAHRAVRGGPAGAVGPGWIEIPGGSSRPALTIDVDRCHDGAALAGQIRQAGRSGPVHLRLHVDPEAPWTGGTTDSSPDPWDDELGGIVETIAAAPHLVILAGPGVVHEHQVPGLHALARVLGAGVLNTWGAKGIFHWRSLHHWATVGLQRDDFSLAGLDDADLVLATGIDDREAPESAWKHRPHAVLAPALLAPLAERLPNRRPAGTMPPLRTRLAAATQAGWESTSTPIAPTLATLHYGRRLAPGGLIAADAGVSGFWVARTFATTELGAVAVPPCTDAGWAVACVTVARMADPLRPALAVVDDRLDEATEAVIEFARSHDTAIGVEIWGQGGEPLAPAAHFERLARLVAPADQGPPASLSTDSDQLDSFVAAAGPVREWDPPAREA